jgi:hypothetical protein
MPVYHEKLCCTNHISFWAREGLLDRSLCMADAQTLGIIVHETLDRLIIPLHDEQVVRSGLLGQGRCRISHVVADEEGQMGPG